MREMPFTYAPTALDRDGIGASQTPLGAGNLTLAGVLMVNSLLAVGAPQFLTVYSAGNVSGVTFTFTGVNDSGVTLSETVTGPTAGNTVATTKSFSSGPLTVSVSGAPGSAVEIGVNGLGNSSPFPLDLYISPFNTSIAVTTVSSATYKLQYTYDNVFLSSWPNGTQVWFDHATMTAKTTADDASINNPVTAVRFVLSVAGSISGQIIQAGRP